MRSGHVAVIGGEDGYGIAGLPALIQRVQQAADLRVELLSESVVVRAALPVIVFGDRAPALRFAPVQTGLAFEAVLKALRHGY